MSDTASTTHAATDRDLARWRSLEAGVYTQLAEELREAGHSIDAGTLAWATYEARRRLMKGAGGRVVFAGRIR